MCCGGRFDFCQRKIELICKPLILTLCFLSAPNTSEFDAKTIKLCPFYRRFLHVFVGGELPLIRKRTLLHTTIGVDHCCSNFAIFRNVVLNLKEK